MATNFGKLKPMDVHTFQTMLTLLQSMASIIFSWLFSLILL